MTSLSITSGLWDHVLSLLVHHDIRYSKKTGTLHEHDMPTIACWVSCPLQKSCLLSTPFLATSTCTDRYYITTPFRCQTCANSRLIKHDHEDIYICLVCGEVGGRVDSHISAYNDACGTSFPQRHKPRLPRQHTLSSYKRLNHFRNVVLRIQAKEDISICSTHITRLREYMKHTYPYTNPEKYTFANIKSALKILRLQCYYNHVFYLIYLFSGKRLVNLSTDQMKTLTNMFIAIQEPFSTCRQSRVNMLSYLYLIRKFSELLGWKRLSRSVPLLKSRIKIRQQDTIWAAICAKMGYQYLPSTI